MVRVPGKTQTPVAPDNELNVVIFNSTELSNYYGDADEEYYRIAQALIKEKSGLEPILKELPELVRTLPEKARQLKTRYDRTTGIVKYLDDLADELDRLPLYPAIRKMFVTSLRATQHQVSSLGFIPPENGWKFSFSRLSRADIMNLELKVDHYLGQFLFATGWGEYIEYEQYLIDGKYCPQRAIEFLDSLKKLSVEPISFSELPYSVKFSWIRSKPDVLKGDIVPYCDTLTTVIGSWSLIEHCETTVNELSYSEAFRTFRLYQTKGERSFWKPPALLDLWAHDFYRYMDPDNLTACEFVDLTLKYVAQLNQDEQISPVPSIDYLESWFTRVAPDSVLSTPRITRVDFADQLALTSSVTSANGNKRNKQTARCKNKKQKINKIDQLSTSIKPAHSSASTSYVYLPRGSGIRYSKPAKFLGKSKNSWCMECGFDHNNPNIHVFVNGKLDLKAMKKESVGRLKHVDKLLRKRK